jgi:hypothetical protein
MFCHDADNIQAPIKNSHWQEIDSLLNNVVITYHGDWGRPVECFAQSREQDERMLQVELTLAEVLRNQSSTIQVGLAN